MELKELIGLHVLRRVEILDDILDQRVARFTLDDFRYEVFEYHLPNGLSKMIGPNVVGRASPADGPGILVFCRHLGTSFSGASCEDADILEIYNANTAEKLLTIGTKNISRNCRCIIDGGSIRIVGFPGRAATAWGGLVEMVPAGDGCVFQFGEREFGDANTPEFDTRYLGRWQIGVDLGGDNHA